jgi:hypothetical protein
VELYYFGRAISGTNERRGVQLLEAAAATGVAPVEVHYHLGKLLLKKPKTKKQGVRELQRYRAEAPDGPLADEAMRLIRGR